MWAVTALITFLLVLLQSLQKSEPLFSKAQRTPIVLPMCQNHVQILKNWQKSLQLAHATKKTAPTKIWTASLENLSFNMNVDHFKVWWAFRKKKMLCKYEIWFWSLLNIYKCTNHDVAFVQDSVTKMDTKEKCTIAMLNNRQFKTVMMSVFAHCLGEQYKVKAAKIKEA